VDAHTQGEETDVMWYEWVGMVGLHEVLEQVEMRVVRVYSDTRNLYP
jgi:hypothetical protein